MPAERDVVDASDPDVFELSVPASADCLSIARLFAAAMIRQEGAEEDTVEDLRLAVSEACTIALQAARSASVLVLSLRPGSDGVAVDIRTAAADARAGVLDAPSDAVTEREHGAEGDAPAVPDPAEGWGAELLEAIVSDLELSSAADGQIEVSFGFPIARIDDPGSGHGAERDLARRDPLDPS
jgi:anti-sigma regulatory factor (Ser/Thr protein kinase)